ncbi:MAG: tetratricopeptide repeat protein [Marinosulfonomonas sp.]
MTEYCDPREVRWTVASDHVGAALVRAMTHYFTFRPDALDQVDGVLDKDPECPMAWVLRGYLLLFARKEELHADAMSALAKAQALRPSALPHERLHIDALDAWCHSRTLDAQKAWDTILEETPHDLLALRVQHFNAIFIGRQKELASHAHRALGSWSDSVPGAGFAYSTACMGLEEINAFREAERIGRRAAELEPDDLWALHSVAHVFEAEGRLEEGLVWMERPASLWENRGSMRHHLWWHEALFLYEAGELDRTLEYYDKKLENTEAFSYLELSNLAALLYRLEAAGIHCGDRWTRLAKRTVPLNGSRNLVFKDIHALLVFAFANDGAQFSQLSGLIEGHAGGDTLEADAMREIGVPVARALAARSNGNAKTAFDVLNAARPAFARMGGSNAQRDLLDILLVDLAVEANETAHAKEAIDRYLEIRPHSAPMIQRMSALEQM